MYVIIFHISTLLQDVSLGSIIIPPKSIQILLYILQTMASIIPLHSNTFQESNHYTSYSVPVNDFTRY